VVGGVKRGEMRVSGTGTGMEVAFSVGLCDWDDDDGGCGG